VYAIFDFVIEQPQFQEGKRESQTTRPTFAPDAVDARQNREMNGHVRLHDQSLFLVRRNYGTEEKGVRSSTFLGF
tara:strand:+ start:580 stop:804 length:225 start_codon:yes stop_codon:yes gene_type:complete